MRRFESRELTEALAHAKQGGQALHVWSPKVGPDGRSGWPRKGVPACFARSREWAHLIDHDTERLIATARRLGVGRIVIGNPGLHSQHVDLCGAPLRRAIEACERGG